MVGYNIGYPGAIAMCDAELICANIKYFEELLRSSPEHPQRQFIEKVLAKERARLRETLASHPEYGGEEIAECLFDRPRIHENDGITTLPRSGAQASKATGLGFLRNLLWSLPSRLHGAGIDSPSS